MAQVIELAQLVLECDRRGAGVDQTQVDEVQTFDSQRAEVSLDPRS